MSFAFQQGTKLTMVYEDNRYQFLVSSVSASQTFVESSQNVKTLHNPNLVTRSFITEESTSSLDFELYLGSGTVEEAIVSWFGFHKLGQNNVVDLENINLKKCDMYVEAPGQDPYVLYNCVGINISFSLSRKELLSIKVNATAPKLEQAPYVPTVGTLFVQNSTEFYNAPITIGGFTNVSSVSCELTRDVQWIKQKTVHDIGSIYNVENAYLKSLALSGTITTFKTDTTKEQVPSTDITINYGDSFAIYMPSCVTTDRWDLGTVHTKATDYKLLPNAVGTYIKF